MTLTTSSMLFLLAPASQFPTPLLLSSVAAPEKRGRVLLDLMSSKPTTWRKWETQSPKGTQHLATQTRKTLHSPSPSSSQQKLLRAAFLTSLRHCGVPASIAGDLRGGQTRQMELGTQKQQWNSQLPCLQQTSSFFHCKDTSCHYIEVVLYKVNHNAIWLSWNVTVPTVRGRFVCLVLLSSSSWFEILALISSYFFSLTSFW